MAMNAPNKTPSSDIIRKGFLLGVVLGLSLVMLGWLLEPTTNPLSIVAVCLVLVIYGLAGYFGFPRIRSELLTLAGVFGLLAGAIFAGEILLEYAILPTDNTGWGVIEFGGAFALYFFSSLIAAYRCKDIRCGILTAVVSAMLSSVIWLLFILLTFYLFRGTTRQEHVFLVEGNYADFARSGMRIFSAFVMEDFLGAGFFHLLLGPILAAILGSIGGLSGLGIAFKFKGKKIYGA
jgi:hypothetical protein